MAKRLRLAISLTGTMCQIMPRGAIPPQSIPSSLYEFTYDRSKKLHNREPFEHEDRLVIFRPTLDKFIELDVSSVDVISLASQQMISSVEKLTGCFDLKIGNSYSVSYDLQDLITTNDEPYCLIDDNLESIKIKMKSLPKGSIFILVDRFDVDDKGFIYYITHLKHGENTTIGRSLNLFQCISLYTYLSHDKSVGGFDLAKFYEESHVHPNSLSYLTMDPQLLWTNSADDVSRR
jgi:hypothetical protein